MLDRTVRLDLVLVTWSITRSLRDNGLSTVFAGLVERNELLRSHGKAPTSLGSCLMSTDFAVDVAMLTGWSAHNADQVELQQMALCGGRPT